MWRRFAQLLACPICAHPLELSAFQEESVAMADQHLQLAEKLGILTDSFNSRVDAGLLLCDGCRTWFPIVRGLPVLLSSTTALHKEFAAQFATGMAGLADSYRSPSLEPVPGEQFVMNSFSKEWLDYKYDGVIWDLSYPDREKAFLSEVGNSIPQNGLFLEIGCGLGLTTFFAHKNFEGNAIGVDLSLAAVRAARHFRDNPFLHFIQASAFRIPLKKDIADLVYSHGVLHVTYSTREAFKAVAPYCRPGGLLYIWVYGTGSQRGSPLRRLAYYVEVLTRPLISQHLSSPLSKSFLALAAVGYLGVNAYHRLRNPGVKRYKFQNALHAARDRFTPLYAYRHDYPEVANWFREEGFEAVEEVDWQTMPSAFHSNFRRNTGVRGRRKLATPVATPGNAS